ncbi:MAG: hypothetical protein EOO88_00010 [Pedobacter sp.]|nr:MAG: hypothetical protein EOO88_00010 [Pedobacter sp.]
MKKLTLFLALAILLLSCKKDQPTDVGTGTALIKRENGSPLPGRPLVSKAIGAQGGTISSDNGSLTLDIPSGALSATTTITIQAVENTLPGSHGQSFKISPENVAFLKPITIRSSYEGIDMEGTHPELLRMAFQTAEGYYYVSPTSELDPVNKTIATQSTHFSTWTVFECYRLSSPNSVLPNGTAELRLKTYVPIGPLGATGERMLGDYIETDDQDPILASAIWRLSGEGDISPKERGCTYTAPGDVPNQNPITVSVELTGNFLGARPGKIQKLILLKPIAIEGGENFTVNINGVSTRVTQGVFFKQSGALYISGLFSGKQINIRISATRTGSFPFKLQSASDAADINITSQTDFLDYMCSFRTACTEQEPTFIFSPGRVEISKYPAQPGEFLQGIVSGATLYTGGNYCTDPRTQQLNASFKILLR